MQEMIRKDVFYFIICETFDNHATSLENHKRLISLSKYRINSDRNQLNVGWELAIIMTIENVHYLTFATHFNGNSIAGSFIEGKNRTIRRSNEFPFLWPTSVKTANSYHRAQKKTITRGDSLKAMIPLTASEEKN